MPLIQGNWNTASEEEKVGIAVTVSTLADLPNIGFTVRTYIFLQYIPIMMFFFYASLLIKGINKCDYVPIKKSNSCQLIDHMNP